MPYTQAGKPETMKLPESNENRPTSCLQKWDHFIPLHIPIKLSTDSGESFHEYSG